MDNRQLSRRLPPHAPPNRRPRIPRSPSARLIDIAVGVAYDSGRIPPLGKALQANCQSAPGGPSSRNRRTNEQNELTSKLLDRHRLWKPATFLVEVGAAEALPIWGAAGRCNFHGLSQGLQRSSTSACSLFRFLGSPPARCQFVRNCDSARQPERRE